MVSEQYLCSKDEVEHCLVVICFQVWVTKSLFPMLLVKICRRCSSRMWHLRLRECPTSPLNGLCNQVWIETQPCGCDRSAFISQLCKLCALLILTKIRQWFYCLFTQDPEYCKYSLCIMHNVCTVQKCFSLGAARRALHAHGAQLCPLTITKENKQDLGLD